MRIFIAVNFPPDVRKQLAFIAEELRKHSSGGRFVKEELFHLTLEFMGNLDEEEVQRLIRLFHDFTFPSFYLQFYGLGSFKKQKGKTWWLGIKDSSELSALKADLHDRLGEAGFPLEERIFRPHVTLGRNLRLSGTVDESKIQALTERIHFPVEAIHIMLSESPGGVLTYTSLYEVPAHSYQKKTR